MTWYAWALVGLYIFSAVLGLVMVDRPRKAQTAEGALLHAVVCCLSIWAIVSLAAH